MANIHVLMIKELKNKILIFINKISHPNYYYGYFYARYTLQHKNELDVDLLLNAYDNTLKKRYDQNIKNVLPLYDKITYSEFGELVLTEYNSILIKASYV